MTFSGCLERLKSMEDYRKMQMTWCCFVVLSTTCKRNIDAWDKVGLHVSAIRTKPKLRKWRKFTDCYVGKQFVDEVESSYTLKVL